MTERKRRFAFGGREETEPEQAEERQQLEESLAQTKLLIHQAYAGFNSVADTDLVESFVYEISALQARYSYLLRKVKELDGAGTVPAGSESPALMEAAEPL